VRRAVVLLLCLGALAGCGGDDAISEVKLLAPPGLVGDVTPFERDTGCQIDLRVYDEDEDLAAIARRRDVDAVAAPVEPGERADDSVELVRIKLEPDLEITIPKRLAAAYDRPTRPAGRRLTRWTIRADGENPDCARRWIAYATSQ
jgi:spermidine/putrescine-binding protein